jgi:hypothetical protein
MRMTFVIYAKDDEQRPPCSSQQERVVMKDETHSPFTVSLRAFLAAWVCCGLVALGALLLTAIRSNDSLAPAMYAGAHIPGSIAPSSIDAGRPSLSSEDERDDLASEGAGGSRHDERAVCAMDKAVAHSQQRIASSYAATRASIC